MLFNDVVTLLWSSYHFSVLKYSDEILPYLESVLNGIPKAQWVIACSPGNMKRKSFTPSLCVFPLFKRFNALHCWPSFRDKRVTTDSNESQRTDFIFSNLLLTSLLHLKVLHSVTLPLYALAHPSVTSSLALKSFLSVTMPCQMSFILPNLYLVLCMYITLHYLAITKVTLPSMFPPSCARARVTFRPARTAFTYWPMLSIGHECYCSRGRPMRARRNKIRGNIACLYLHPTLSFLHPTLLL